MSVSAQVLLPITLILMAYYAHPLHQILSLEMEQLEEFSLVMEQLLKLQEADLPLIAA